tara:strand:+ start:1192 stop:1497 length:306 start_codon:yes stop_codon:yes gene_type:complete
MIIEAIKALGVKGFACDSAPTKKAFESTYRSDSVDNPTITWEQVSAKIDELQAEFDAKQYQRDRQYPSIGDQLDMQYHDQLDGTTTWKDAIAKVKSDNPKE